MLQVSPGFARLLSTENIGVRVNDHASTATFNTKSRLLTMPNWDCSDRLRDMLIGHECAHAIFTNDGGNLESAIARVGSNMVVAKDYLNVAEDARIDRLIQLRYPGLRVDYRAGRREMVTRDFFGLNGRDPNSLEFIDRFNCHFKGVGDIEFSPEEMIFVNRGTRIDTFDDAIALAKDMYEFSAPNSKKNRQEPQYGEDGQDGDDGEGDESPDESSDDSSDGESSDDASDDDNGAISSGDGDDDDDTEGDDAESSDSGSQDNFTDSCPPSSITQKSVDDAIANTAKISQAYTPAMAYELPTGCDLSTIIISYKEIIEMTKAHESTTQNSEWSRFKSAASTTVTHLAQMFERKKAAAVSSRTAVAKTGRLDTTKLHNYKMTEDLFLRNRVVSKGKNHGILVFVDWSGSMSNCIIETIQQTIVLAMFCKKVGIPFRVCGFSTYVRPENYNNDDDSKKCWINDLHPADSETHAIHLSEFSLLELFSDKMNYSEFQKMAGMLLSISQWCAPPVLGLGGTPLNECIAAGLFYGRRFRAENRIDVMNTIFITDGGAMSPFFGATGTVQDRASGRVWTWDTHADRFRAESRGGTNLLLRIYKDLVGGNLIGIYLDSGRDILKSIRYLSHRTYDKKFNPSKMIKSLQESNFVEFPHKGYDTYYLMDKKTAVYMGSDKLDNLPETATNARIINAFKADLARRNMSRPLLSSFTDKIAREIV